MQINAKLQIIFLVAALLPETLLDYSLTPLYPFLVEHLEPQTVERGYLSGALTSAYYLPLLVCNIIWGFLSDRIGRRLVLVLGLLGCIVSSLMLAFAASYRAALLARLIAGMFGANSTVTKGFIGDVTRDQRTRSWGYAIYGAIFGFCGLIGPVLGGLLTFPASTFPVWFGNPLDRSNVFVRYPFCVIPVLCAMLSVGAMYIVVFYVSESQPDDVYKEVDPVDVDLVMEELALDELGSQPGPRPTQFVVTWQSMGPIFLYCVLAFTGMTYNTLLPLFLTGKRTDGGLDRNPKQVSSYFLVSAASNFFLSITNICDTIMLACGGPLRAYSFSMLLYVPTLLAFPILAVTSGLVQTIAAGVALGMLGGLEAEAFQTVILLITESQTPEHLGKTHGVATSLAAVARSISPALTGILWDWSTSLHWNWFAFVFGAIMAVLGGVASFH
ncbi:hypothetical protein HDU91_002842 [Kappamyces sp. JEL0680]|nr:hypothetical protein HDU91_002842 [Kappamyces sp. JEL0680]